MGAPYGALPSTLASTRSTVPATLASAAALTLAATSPVSAFSVFPLTVCRPPLCCWAVGVAEAEDDAVDDAALAMPAPPTAAAPTAALVPSLDRSVAMAFSLMDERDDVNVASRPARTPREA